MTEHYNEKCPCKRLKCERFGKCAECLEHHSKSKMPAYCKRAAKPKKPSSTK